MRAARTPPEPAPMTKRSTSSDISIGPDQQSGEGSEIVVTPLPHLRAHLAHQILGVFLDPSLGALADRLAGLRLAVDDPLAERRLEEFKHVLEVLLGINAGIAARDFLVQLLPPRGGVAAHGLHRCIDI